MVDSVKNYGIAGASKTVELGKQGAVIDATDSAIISLKDKDGALEEVMIANGTASSHAVTKAQLDASSSQKLNYISATVSYDGGTSSLGTAAANTTIQKVVVEKGTGNWTGHNDATEITVGDAADNDRLFNGFDPDGGQFIFDNDYTYASSTALLVYITQGGANAGTATVKVFYTGTIE
tara:strand:+ start:532 stop:1068 length:537 start_codon:yes stop_codon:yes gene_type:complete